MKRVQSYPSLNTCSTGSETHSADSDGWRSRSVTEGFRNGDASSSSLAAKGFRSVRPNLQDKKSPVPVPLLPPRRESYHMTPNPPPYSSLPMLSSPSLAPSGSYTIKSSLSSSYSYSKTTHTTTSTADRSPEANANANSHITRLLERKVPSLKLASDKTRASPPNVKANAVDPNMANANATKVNTVKTTVANANPTEVDMANVQVTNDRNLSQHEPKEATPITPPNPPPRRESTSAPPTHTASLSIQIAPKGSELQAGSVAPSAPRPENQGPASSPAVPPRPSADVLLDTSPPRGGAAVSGPPSPDPSARRSPFSCASQDSPDFLSGLLPKALSPTPYASPERSGLVPSPVASPLTVSALSHYSSSTAVLEELQICGLDSPMATPTPSPTLSHTSVMPDDGPALHTPATAADANVTIT
ncbi:hypothetical protein MHYP_G00252180 [Metynnis hypsauchen]